MSLEERRGKRKARSGASRSLQSWICVRLYSNPRGTGEKVGGGGSTGSIWVPSPKASHDSKLPLLSPQLPEVSAKAAEKGYSVGDLLQEVMKFAKERQLDEAVGNMARKQLLDWLLTNL